MTDITPFLEPISPDAPCGKDVSYDQAYLNLEILVKGREETQFSAAEEPNWKEVRASAIELIRQSKNLRLAIILTLALLETEGLEGFRSGLLLLKSWIEAYWDTLYPLLDPEDNNDPIQRVNLLQTLSSKGTTEEKFFDRLSETVLAESPRLGHYNFKAISGGMAKQEVDGAFTDTPPERVRARYDAAVEAYTLVKDMDGLLGEKIGRDRAPSFGELMGLLNQMTSLLGAHCGGAPVAAAEAVAGAPAAQQQAGGGGGGTSLSAINSRADVVRALQAICNYYKAAEPASPIPLLLERAQRLVDKNFMQIIDDLAPNAMSQFELLGPKPAQKDGE
jgi:type VI secretion system protein ImpA